MAVDKTTARILDALKPKTPVRGEDPTCYCGLPFFDNDLLWRHIVKCPEARTATLAHLRDARGHRLLAICGTSGGARRHYRRGEPLCDACVQAEREANTKKHARRRLDPATVEADRAAARKYREDPAVREAGRERHARKKADPAYLAARREYDRKYRDNPAAKARIAEYQREYRARKKAEREAQSGA